MRPCRTTGETRTLRLQRTETVATPQRPRGALLTAAECGGEANPENPIADETAADGVAGYVLSLLTLGTATPSHELQRTRHHGSHGAQLLLAGMTCA